VQAWRLTGRELRLGSGRAKWGSIEFPVLYLRLGHAVRHCNVFADR
jgi:hypothetical protein